MYTSYLNKYEDKCSLLRGEEASSAALRQFMTNAHAQPECKNLLIADFLIKPLHRLTRYTLLLKSMMNSCKPHEQHVRDELSSAISKVSQVTAAVNSSVRDADNRRKVVVVSEELQGALPDLIQPARRYVMEVTFSQYGQHGDTGVPVSVYLFNDLVVTALRKKEFFSAPLEVHQFEISEMLLQLDVDQENPVVQIIRFFHGERLVQLCTTNFEEEVELVEKLIRSHAVVEGMPYAHNRELLQFPKVSLCLFGEPKCGKSGFLRALCDLKKSVYQFLEEPAHVAHSSELFEQFVVPFAAQATQPYNLEFIDTHSDERVNFDHKQNNRGLFSKADILVFFYNSDRDPHVQYWKEQIAGIWTGSDRPPIVVVGTHETREPSDLDPTNSQACQEFGAIGGLTCVWTDSNSVNQTIASILKLISKPKAPASRLSSLSFMGIEINY
eukprot:c18050_g1_i3.p1 GENE.c18050_g1_i3~~c18050_g1_i3.p1  ORF type:complete len:441 (+),score=72.76 c18050_g1_i3:596-1918(+)